jgi:hypothetical protein
LLAHNLVVTLTTHKDTRTYLSRKMASTIKLAERFIRRLVPQWRCDGGRHQEAEEAVHHCRFCRTSTGRLVATVAGGFIGIKPHILCKKTGAFA